MRAAPSVLAILLAVGLLASPLSTEAQSAAKVPRIGVLLAGSRDDTRQVSEAFRGLGYVEGRNVTIEHRFAEGRLDRAFDLASELVRLQIDVIVAPGTALAQATGKATAPIPIGLVTPTGPRGTSAASRPSSRAAP